MPALEPCEHRGGCVRGLAEGNRSFSMCAYTCEVEAFFGRHRHRNLSFGHLLPLDPAQLHFVHFGERLRTKTNTRVSMVFGFGLTPKNFVQQMPGETL